MKVVSAQEMQHIDRAAIEELGFPGEVLMGLAGKSVADHIISQYSGFKRICIFCGKGNNGGDGFVIAHFLNNSGFDIDVYVTGMLNAISETSRIYAGLCKKTGIVIHEITDASGLSGVQAGSYDLIVDAMLGTGFSGTARGIAADVISIINSSGTAVLSVDVPSGLTSNGEAPEGEAVRADETVTMGLPKISLVTYPGKLYTGRLKVVDIGFPASAVDAQNINVRLIDGGFFNQYYAPSDDEDCHKGDRGHLVCIGGFDNMEGAILLAASAAFETGAGLATAVTTSSARKIIAGTIPELMTAGLDFDDNTGFAGRFEKILASRNIDACIIGPGLGRGVDSRKIFNLAVERAGHYGIEQVLIDGDGLYHLAFFLKNRKLNPDVQWIITPHFMEASRLNGMSVAEIKKNRFKACVDLARTTGAVALLKGPASIISDGVMTVINTTGNSALATAGSGDVLTGVIGAMMLTGCSLLHAAALGAFVHGRAAELHAAASGHPFMSAGDIIDYIRPSIAALHRKKSS